MCANENKDMKHSACATRSIKGPRSPVNELRYRRRCTSRSCQRFRLHAGAATRLKRCTSPTLSLRLMHLKVWRARRTHEIEHCCQHGSSTPATKKNRHAQNLAAFTFALVDLLMCSTDTLHRHDDFACSGISRLLWVDVCTDGLWFHKRK